MKAWKIILIICLCILTIFVSVTSIIIINKLNNTGSIVDIAIDILPNGLTFTDNNLLRTYSNEWCDVELISITRDAATGFSIVSANIVNKTDIPISIYLDNFYINNIPVSAYNNYIDVAAHSMSTMNLYLNTNTIGGNLVFYAQISACGNVIYSANVNFTL